MAVIPKSLVVALGIAIVLASLLAVARPVAAAQNRPSWSQGDFWVYTRTQGTTTSTIRLDVQERSTLTLALGTYQVWHVTQTTTDASGNSVVTHIWVQDSNLGIAKANFSVPGFGDVQVTFDPPLAQAVFPLSAGATWSLSSTLQVVNTTFQFPFPYSASVTAEQSTTVAAGTFNVAVVRSPATGAQRDENQYSEGAGNSVKQESYDSSGNRVATQELTSFRYWSGTLSLILLIVVAIVIAAVVIGAVVTLRRRRRRRGAPPVAPPTPPPPTE